MKRIYRLVHNEARQRAANDCMNAPEGYVVEVKEATRTLEQNALLWALLSEIESQCDWHGLKLSAEEWKDLLSAGLMKSKVVPNMEGNGFVILGQRTSKMSKRDFSDLVELIHAFAAERGVVLSDREAA